MNRKNQKNPEKPLFERLKCHIEKVYRVSVWITDGTTDDYYISSPDELEKIKSEIYRFNDPEEIEAIVCDDEPIEMEFVGPDFTDPDLAESIYRFISQTERLGDVRRKKLSMIEYVTMVCPHEFKEWLTSEDGAPDSGAVDQLSSR